MILLYLAYAFIQALFVLSRIKKAKNDPGTTSVPALHTAIVIFLMILAPLTTIGLFVTLVKYIRGMS